MKTFSFMSNLQTNYDFKLDFHEVDQHTEDRWSNHGIKHREDHLWPSRELPCEYPN